jgi:hypothetical protein
MALPLVPFAAGIAVGSLATIGATDNPLRQRLINGSKDLYARIAGGAESVVAMIPGLGSKKVDLSDLSEAGDAVVQKAEAAADAVKKTVKKTRKQAEAKAEEVADDVADAVS